MSGRSRSALEHLPATGKLPRNARVRRRREFARAQRHGLRVHTQAFTVVVIAGDRARLGCAVSRRVGSAVVRARVRRLIREVFRRMAANLPAADFVVIAKPDAAQVAEAGLAATASMLGPAIETAGRRVAGARR